METEKNAVDKQTLANDLRTQLQGILEPALVDSAVNQLLTTTNRYPATGSVASMIFYLKFRVDVTNGKSFEGNAGGVSSPGGGALFGDVYTDDIDRLYRDTVSFQFNATPVYTNLNFFDSHSNFLGSFQSGSVSTVLGTGGGKGSWS
ncbi:VapA/VapB family virulence-associated protein [Spirosoma sp. RP8]|uniref:VapA/VapB family virulence-associated protein n=1 Tax=Spirosoma liriopis TaxID=2937440 RepID=A0ABT0HSP1_9BACT|nr:VapA/VapB family virulence-associated protein [Spirosoma liriopis]MCK8495194.1 VapA/VapB family virulence-associated protein [Spirosoma liriopis]